MFKPELKVKSNLLLPLDIQFFSDNPDGGQGNENKDGGQAGEQNTEVKDNKQDNQDQSSGNENLFTQEDVNNVVARETRKVEERLLKKLGVKDAKDAKDALEKYNQMKQEQLSDQERITQENSTLKTENQDYQTKVAQLETQIAVLKADVNPESADDVVVLANNLVNDDTDIEQAIAKVLEKYPHFKKEATVVEENKDDNQQQNPKPKFSTGDHKDDGKVGEDEVWKNAFKFI